jgi:membrane-bound serine protease (ClpP class)
MNERMLRRIPVLLLSAAALALRPEIGRAQSSPPPSLSAGPSSVLVLQVAGSVDRTLAGYLDDGIATAERDGSVVVIELDTAGTLDQNALAIAERIHRASVPVVVWVGPAPAKAAGAGLVFLEASGLAAVAPGAGIGPLEPLDLVRRDGGVSPAALERTIARWASDAGRPAPAIPNGEVPAQTALDDHLVELAAPTVTSLLDEIDGRAVSTSNGTVTLHTRVATAEGQPTVQIRFTAPGPVDRILHAVSSPAAIYVLLVLGLAAIAFELTQPGFGFAGVSGVLMLALAIYGLTAVPPSSFGLVVLILGVALMDLDVVLRRLGAITLAGAAAFALGSWLAFRDVSPVIGISPWLIAGAVVASVLYYGFALTVAVRSRERITSTQQGLVGLVGEARGELHPEGPVFVKGTLWRGKSNDGPIPAGTRIRVRGVDGLILRVEPDPGADPPSTA